MEDSHKKFYDAIKKGVKEEADKIELKASRICPKLNPCWQIYLLNGKGKLKYIDTKTVNVMHSDKTLIGVEVGVETNTWR